MTTPNAILRSIAAALRKPKGGDGLACANAMLDAADAAGRELNVVTLQRLLVLAQGWSVALRGEPLFREPVSMLLDRPYVAAVHDAFRSCGAEPIRRRATWFWSETFDVPAEADPERLRIIRAVEDSYRDFGGWRLGGLLSRAMSGRGPANGPVDVEELGRALSETAARDADARPTGARA